MTMQELLTNYFQEKRPYYIEWDKQPAEFKDYFVMNYQEMGQYHLIISLSSWRDLPIPPIYEKEIQPQIKFFDGWTGVSRYTSSNTFKVMTWFSLLMREELIKPKRAYFLNLTEPIDCYDWEGNVIAEHQTSYISVFCWRNIIFLCGKIISDKPLLVGRLDDVYRWMKHQSPPKNLRSFVSPLSNERLLAYEKWLLKHMKHIPLGIARASTHQIHYQLPKKIRGYRFVHRGYAQIYAVTEKITARIHPEFEGQKYDMEYRWENEYCIVIDLGFLHGGRDALKIVGKNFHAADSPHPHIESSGHCCYGTYDRTLEGLLREFDLVGIMQVARNFCAIINPDSQLVHFDDMKIAADQTCDHCGSEVYDEDDDYYRCGGCGNGLCYDCRRYCETCQLEIGKCCGSTFYCESCEDYFCEEHISSCEMCEQYLCLDCSYSCYDCCKTLCGSTHCRTDCCECGEQFCPDCIKKINNKTFCGDCAESFLEDKIKCNRCGNYGNEEEIIGCFQCGVIRCPDCLLTCETCGEEFCRQCITYYKETDKTFVTDICKDCLNKLDQTNLSSGLKAHE